MSRGKLMPLPSNHLPLAVDCRLWPRRKGGWWCIPPRDRRGGGLWNVALLFSAIVAIATVLVLISLAGPPPQPGRREVDLAFLGVLWLIGTGLWLFALKRRYERNLLSVDQEGVVMQTSLFGYTHPKQLTVDAITECDVVGVDLMSSVPAYEVHISNPGQTLRLASPLSLNESVWLADQIDVAIGKVQAIGLSNDEGEVSCEARGGTTNRLPVDPVSPEELPRNSGIRVLEDEPGLLSVTFPVGQQFPVGNIMVGVALLGLGLWLSWGVALLVVFPMILAAHDLRQRNTLRLTPDLLDCQLGTGTSARRHVLPVDTIEAVVIQRVYTAISSLKVDSHAIEGCRLACADQSLLVCPPGDPHRARELAGLLLWKLHSWEHTGHIPLREVEPVVDEIIAEQKCGNDCA